MINASVLELVPFCPRLGLPFAILDDQVSLYCRLTAFFFCFLGRMLCQETVQR